MSAYQALFITDALPETPEWNRVEALIPTLCDRINARSQSPIEGSLAFLKVQRGITHALEDYPQNLKSCLMDTGSDRETLLLPLSLELSVFEKSLITEAMREARRDNPDRLFYYDDPQPSHPLVVQHFSMLIQQCLAQHVPPGQKVELILAARGDTDPECRAECYKVMRLLWEQCQLRSGSVRFVQQQQESLLAALRHPAEGPRLVLPLCLFDGELYDHCEVIFNDHGAAQDHLTPRSPRTTEIEGWLEQRIMKLIADLGSKRALRQRSSRYMPIEGGTLWSQDPTLPLGETGPFDRDRIRFPLIATIKQPQELAKCLDLLDLGPEPYFVKPTWHGYAHGTYTDPIALDCLLGALPGRAILLEGYTMSRALAEDTTVQQQDPLAHRHWFHQQDRAYLERTGLLAIIKKHKAEYINVSEVHWNGQCADRAQIQAILKESNAKVTNQDLLDFVPQLCLDNRGQDFISFARFKGASRLSISNLFGLIPAPSRIPWHGPNVSFFAEVCCDLARIYGSIFNLIGMVESLHTAIRWNRQGLYRSRWGNYDCIDSPQVVVAGRDIADVDATANRLQGFDYEKSAFFDVIRDRLGISENASRPLLEEVMTLLQ